VDCLQLLYGRLLQMNTFIVTIDWFRSYSPANIDNMVTTIIKGTHLNNEILSQISHLHTFIFDIVTHCVNRNAVQKSPDNIRCTFIQHVDCYVDYFPWIIYMILPTIFLVEYS
jgi:hypothetical protein